MKPRLAYNKEKNINQWNGKQTDVRINKNKNCFFRKKKIKSPNPDIVDVQEQQKDPGNLY